MPRSAIEEVARRHDRRDVLQRDRHAGDREDEARQNERRQHRDERRRLKRDLLRLGDGRDDEAGAERADQEERRRRATAPASGRASAGRRTPSPPRRSPIAPICDSTRYGSVLPTTNASVEMGAIRTCSIVPRSFSRTIDSAVEITAVIIEMNAMRPGTRKTRAPKLRVVPDARLDADERRLQAAWPTTPTRLSQDGRDVAEHRRRGVGVVAVDDDLDLGGVCRVADRRARSRAGITSTARAVPRSMSAVASRPATSASPRRRNRWSGRSRR